MYPSFNDFDYYADAREPEEFEDDDRAEVDVIAGVEIRGSEPEDDWSGEELPF